MKLNEDDKIYIINEFLRTISHITDEEYQRRVWIEGRGPECDDFDESVCSFFDVGDSILENYKSFGITDNQYNLLKNLRNEYKIFCDESGLEHYLPECFIKTAEWKNIMKIAKEVLKSFNYRKTSASCKPIKNRDQIDEHDWIVLDKIFNDPDKIVYPLQNGCLKIYPGKGKGAFFKKDGSFGGFIERKTTQKSALIYSILKMFVRGCKKLFFVLVSKYSTPLGKGEEGNSEQKRNFLIELCYDLDFKRIVVYISYDMQIIASINCDKGVDAVKVEILPFGSDSQKTILPLQNFLSALEKAKKLAIKHAKKGTL